MPEDAERKGIGTPATRAAVLEKLVSSGFVERRKSKKVSTLIPSALGTALITVLPEALQSPLLTAEWEHRLKEVERGELPMEDFMESIAAMLRELIQTYRPIPDAAVLFPSEFEIIGKYSIVIIHHVPHTQRIICLFQQMPTYSARTAQITINPVPGLFSEVIDRSG